MFKAAFVVLAPDGDPEKHRTKITTDTLELTTVVTTIFDFDKAAEVCKNLVQNEGVQSITLCPGFPHAAVAKIANAVGEGVAVQVSRGDVPSNMIIGQVLTKEGWIPEEH